MTLPRSNFTVLRNEILGQRLPFGTVYKAWDEQEGRHVAAKILNGESESEEQVEALLKEFTQLTQLKHENIVQVIAFEVEHEKVSTGCSSPHVRGVARIFMEWLPSGSLQSVLRSTGERAEGRT